MSVEGGKHLDIPKYLTKRESIKSKANKTEAKACKKRGGNPHKRSGAGKFSKCDFNVGEIHYEHKSTDKKYFRLDFLYLTQLLVRAHMLGKKTVMCIEPEHPSFRGLSFIVMEESFFKELVENAKK